jgi:hypothetical protein
VTGEERRGLRRLIDATTRERLAGEIVCVRRAPWTEDVLIRAVRSFVERERRIPRKADFEEDPSLSSRKVVYRLFGSLAILFERARVDELLIEVETEVAA